MDGTYAYDLERPPLQRLEQHLRAELNRAEAFLPDDPMTAHSIALAVEKQLRPIAEAQVGLESLLVQAQRAVARSRQASQRFLDDAKRRNRAFHARERRQLATPVERLRCPAPRQA